MILTDREIEVALDHQQIIVTPAPDRGTALSSTTLDLTLSRQFVTWEDTRGMHISPGDPNFSFARLAKLQKKIETDQYILDPGAFVLAWTAEHLSLPMTSRIAARV